MANNIQRVSITKWPGVYFYESDQRKYQGKSDVCYYITFKVDGRKKTEKVGWKSEGYSPQVAAELRAARVKDSRHGNQVQTSKEIRQEKRLTNRTIGELKDSYFSSEKGLNLKGLKTDLNRYEKHIGPNLSKKRVDHLKIDDIDRLKDDLKGHAPATTANVLELLRRIINHGVKKKICPPVAFKIELPRKDNQITEYLTPSEADRLMRVLEEWGNRDVARMLQVAWLTGMRRGEIFKIEDRDCDFNQKIITLRNPKGARTETIPMSGPVEELLREQITDRDRLFPESHFVFPGRGGRQRTDSSAVDRIKAAANLPVNFRIFHGLRHHMAVTLASSGEFTLDMIGSLLTHKSYEMTKRYAKFLPDAKKKASDRATELLKEHAQIIRKEKGK